MESFLRGTSGTEAPIKKAKERIYKWDNLKALLMITVVLGHFTNQFAAGEGALPLFRGMSIWIYSFHMPLFIFMSGLMCRKWDERSAFSWRKPVYFAMIGYLMKLFIYFIKIGFGKHPHFMFLSDTGIPWYMFAMAAFMVLGYMVRKQDPTKVLLASVAIACAAGYVNSIGSFLNLSRIIVFFPCYYLGYVLVEKDVREFASSKWLKLPSVLVIALVTWACFGMTNVFYPYIRLFTARNAYALIHVAKCGFMDRLAFYGIALLMGGAIMCLTPNIRIPLLDKIGQRTLQIYFWHRLILYVISYSGLVTLMQRHLGAGWIPAYLLLALILTAILSAKIFSLPLDLLTRWHKAAIHVMDECGAGLGAAFQGRVHRMRLRGSQILTFVMGLPVFSAILLVFYYVQA